MKGLLIAVTVRKGFRRLPGTNTSLLRKFVNYGQKESL